jgi:hypothetical protein
MSPPGPKYMEKDVSTPVPSVTVYLVRHKSVTERRIRRRLYIKTKIHPGTKLINAITTVAGNNEVEIAMKTTHFTILRPNTRPMTILPTPSPRRWNTL